MVLCLNNPIHGAFIIEKKKICGVQLEFPLQNFEVNFTCMCSAEMLLNLEVPWVILGHSERRALLNESNEVTSVTWT